MRYSLFCLSVAALFACGCGGSDVPDVPETAPVTGTVMLNGQPVEGAAVQFVPSSGAGAAEGVYAATGTTGPDGKFSLTTFFTPEAISDGAVPGKYNVTVTKFVAPEAAPSGGDAHGESKAVSKNTLPGKFASSSTTTLSANVEAGKTNDFPLDLK